MEEHNGRAGAQVIVRKHHAPQYSLPSKNGYAWSILLADGCAYSGTAPLAPVPR